MLYPPSMKMAPITASNRFASRACFRRPPVFSSPRPTRNVLAKLQSFGDLGERGGTDEVVLHKRQPALVELWMVSEKVLRNDEAEYRIAKKLKGFVLTLADHVLIVWRQILERPGTVRQSSLKKLDFLEFVPDDPLELARLV